MDISRLPKAEQDQYHQLLSKYRNITSQVTHSSVAVTLFDLYLTFICDHNGF